MELEARPQLDPDDPADTDGPAAEVTPIPTIDFPPPAHTAAQEPAAEAAIRPVFRDAVFRWLLAIADLVAAALALGLITLASGHGIPTASIVSIPLIVVIAKMTGRYDHDDVVLRKSTLDEIPSLLTLAGAFALMWSVIAFLSGDQLHLRGGGFALLWIATAFLLVIARTTGRLIARLTAPRERVLIVGSAMARERLAFSLGTDPAARLDIVGYLPLEDERRRKSDWGPAPAAAGSSPSTTSPRSCRSSTSIASS